MTAEVAGLLPRGMASAVLLAEVPDRTLVELQVAVAEDGSGADTVAAQRVLGFGLPGPGRFATPADGTSSAVWLGPGWWLLDVPVAPAGAGQLEAPLVQRLRATGPALSAVEVGAGFVVLELVGPAARAVLAHGCSLDLHPRAFAPGSAARTTLAKAQVVLAQTGDAPAYRVWVRRSFARYLVEWLVDAASESLAGQAS